MNSVATPDGRLDLARLGFALARANGNPLRGVEVARDLARTHKSFERPERILRSAVDAGTTSDPAWAGSLADARISSASFLDSLKPISPLDAMAPAAAGNVPARTKIVVSTVAVNGSIVAQGVPKPISSMEFNASAADEQKATALVVLPKELLQMATPAAVTMIHRAVAAACATAANAKFLADLVAAADTAAHIPATDDFLVDLNRALSVVAARGAGRYFIIVPPSVAVDLATDERAAFDQMTPNGGSIRGITTLVSEATTDIVVVDASQLNIDPGLVVLDTASSATLQMSDAPAAGAQELTSLFQTNSVALRAERWISYSVLSANAVAVIESPDYVP